jgi:hypothetical protein
VRPHLNCICLRPVLLINERHPQTVQQLGRMGIAEAGWSSDTQVRNSGLSMIGRRWPAPTSRSPRSPPSLQLGLQRSNSSPLATPLPSVAHDAARHLLTLLHSLVPCARQLPLQLPSLAPPASFPSIGRVCHPAQLAPPTRPHSLSPICPRAFWLARRTC